MHDSAPPDGLPVIRAAGSRFELGRAQGRAQRAHIQAFLGDRLARIAPLLGRKFDEAAVRGTVRAYRAVIEERLPLMAQEVDGLASGAGIGLDDAYLLQLRREAVGYQKIPAAGDCTTMALLAGHDTTLAQTIDLNGGMRSELAVLDLTLPEDGRQVLMASFTGLLGYLGMNSRGLGICLNLVLAGDWRPGIPGYMLIRHLLDTADTVDDCIRIIGALPRASSRALTISDGIRLACVEYTPTEVTVKWADRMAHANHFLDARLATLDELNPFARNASLARQESCAASLAGLRADAAAQAYFEALSAAPIHIADNGDVRRECTVGTVVLRPGRGWMAVQPGGAGDVHTFHLGQPVLLTHSTETYAAD